MEEEQKECELHFGIASLLLQSSAFNDHFLSQHENFSENGWVICSICQKTDEEAAKFQLPKSNPTTTLQRHIKDIHPELIDNEVSYAKEKVSAADINEVQYMH